MKLLKIILIFIVILITNYSSGAEPLKNSYVKNVWREIEAKVDSAMFMPTFDRNSYEWESEGAEGFDIERYNEYYEGCAKNLWNIIHRNIIDDKLRLYAPWNPMWIDEMDDGFFRFPIVSDDEIPNTNFIANAEFRKKLVGWQILGYEYPGIPEEMGSIQYPGEDSIDVRGNTVYYPFPTLWYQERDIIKFRIREANIMDKNGALKKRVVRGIAPVVNKMDYNGNIVGEKVLFWVKFEEISTILKKQYLMVDQGKRPKVMSYYKYFVNRLFSSKIVKQESVYLTKIE